jgi:hypothetical protein
MDVYPRAEEGVPVVVFNHGAAGYCRLFVRLALEYHDRGYTGALPGARADPRRIAGSSPLAAL